MIQFDIFEIYNKFISNYKSILIPLGLFTHILSPMSVPKMLTTLITDTAIIILIFFILTPVFSFND